MSSTSYGGMLSSYERTSTDAGSALGLEGLGPRPVQIQAMSHSTTVNVGNMAVPKLSSSSTASSKTAGGIPSLLHSEDQAKESEYPYDIPSASNGQPMELRHAASMPIKAGDGPDAIHSNKGSGLRAALANKFTGKKIKDFRLSVSVSSKRQQHQLESLMSQSNGAEDGGGMSSVPMVRGMPVGHPMSFQHVEHLSPTQVAPKMALINSMDHSAKQAPGRAKLSSSSISRRSLAGDGNNSNGSLQRQQSPQLKPQLSQQPQEQQQEQQPAYQIHSKSPQPLPEKRLNFRSLKPAALMTKASKLSLPGISSISNGISTSISGGTNKQNVPSVPTIRGKPISGPSNFQHVEHLSPEEHSTQQFHLLNHRQQQQEILSMIAQSPTGVSKARSNTRGPDANKPEKIMFRGLPLSRPLTFEHVEHVSPREYKAHMETKELVEVDSAATGVSAYAPRLSDEPAGRLSDDDDDINMAAESGGHRRENSASASLHSRHSDQRARPRLVALQHTSQNPATAMAANLSNTLNVGGVRRPTNELTLDEAAEDAVANAQIISANTPGSNIKGKFVVKTVAVEKLLWIVAKGPSARCLCICTYGILQ
ncbi:hypothetical protein LPJ59_002707 [Coemansia sp. RSA 2399]|nr:hypothetical protein LPJ59_002707 [Coemansia sp. RSA 2399]